MSADIISFADRRQTPVRPNAAPSAQPERSRFTKAEQDRILLLLLNDIASNLGIRGEMDAKFGALIPEPGDNALRARRNAARRGL